MRQALRAQKKRVADAAFVDEFLIDLADAHPLGRVDRVLAGVGDRAAVDQGEALAAGQRVQTLVDAVPADARLQGGQTLRGRKTRFGGRLALPIRLEAITAGDHFQDGVERRRRQIAIGIRLPDEVIKVGDGPIVHRRHRDHLLSEHVETVHRHAQCFNAAGGHFGARTA